jgi:hypothetical protein
MLYPNTHSWHDFNPDPLGKQPMTVPLPTVFEAAPQPKWEYHTVSFDPREEPPLDEARLAELGQDGWLLAAILSTPGGERVTRVTYYFVRSA